jgi:hypothetical protein
MTNRDDPELDLRFDEADLSYEQWVVDELRVAARSGNIDAGLRLLREIIELLKHGPGLERTIT